MKRLISLLVSLALLTFSIRALAEEPAALLPDASVYAAETAKSTIDASAKIHLYSRRGSFFLLWLLVAYPTSFFIDPFF